MIDLDDLNGAYDPDELPDEEKLATASDTPAPPPSSASTPDTPAADASEGRPKEEPSAGLVSTDSGSTTPAPATGTGLVPSSQHNVENALNRDVGGPIGLAQSEPVIIDAEFVEINSPGGKSEDAPADGTAADPTSAAGTSADNSGSEGTDGPVREEVRPDGKFPFEEVDIGQRTQSRGTQTAQDPFAGMGEGPIQGAAPTSAGAMPHPAFQAAPQPMPGGHYPGGGGGGVAGGAGAAAAAIGELAGQAIGMVGAAAAGVSKGMARSIHSYISRNGAQAQANATQNAEAAIVEAELAANRLIKAAQDFRSTPQMKSFISEMEAAARPKGRLVSDIIREMKPGGSQAGLWDKFQGVLSSNQSMATAHMDLGSHMTAYQTAWTKAADAVDAAGGSPDALWNRLDKATSAVRTETQDIPAESGRSFADMARELMERMRETFCRIFRIAPTRSASAPAP